MSEENPARETACRMQASSPKISHDASHGITVEGDWESEPGLGRLDLLMFALVLSDEQTAHLGKYKSHLRLFPDEIDYILEVVSKRVESGVMDKGISPHPITRENPREMELYIFSKFLHRLRTNNPQFLNICETEREVRSTLEELSAVIRGTIQAKLGYPISPGIQARRSAWTRI